MVKKIVLPGNATGRVELGRRGFRVNGDVLEKRGKKYHMPRALKKYIRDGSSDGITFIEQEVKPLIEVNIKPLNTAVLAKKITKETDKLVDKAIKEFFVPETRNDSVQISTDGKWKVYAPRSTSGRAVAPTSNRRSYILDDNTISFFHKGQVHQATSSNPTFNDIVTLVKSGDIEKAVELVNVAKAINVASDGQIVNNGGVLNHDGVDLNDTVIDWLTSNMSRKDGSVQAVVNFLKKCNTNPSPGSIDMLWRFIKTNGLVLFHDGDFLGYRYVSDDLKDCHSNTYDNTPGQVCSMPREDVTYDPNRHCAPGLHVGAWSHVEGKRNVIEVKVNPTDVVSVPTGEDWKMRVCCFTSYRLLRQYGSEVSSRTEHFVKL